MHFFVIPTDAHNYKIIGMLKTIKKSDNCSDSSNMKKDIRNSKSSVAVACFLTGQAKDLSAPL